MRFVVDSISPLKWDTQDALGALRELMKSEVSKALYDKDDKVYNSIQDPELISKYYQMDTRDNHEFNIMVIAALIAYNLDSQFDKILEYHGLKI